MQPSPTLSEEDMPPEARNADDSDTLAWFDTRSGCVGSITSVFSPGVTCPCISIFVFSYWISPLWMSERKQYPLRSRKAHRIGAREIGFPCTSDSQHFDNVKFAVQVLEITQLHFLPANTTGSILQRLVTGMNAQSHSTMSSLVDNPHPTCDKKSLDLVVSPASLQ